MKEGLTSLLKKYEPLGQWEAGELLLHPANALRLAMICLPTDDQ
jgi:hypothetical protein